MTLKPTAAGPGWSDPSLNHLLFKFVILTITLITCLVCQCYVPLMYCSIYVFPLCIFPVASSSVIFSGSEVTKELCFFTNQLLKSLILSCLHPPPIFIHSSAAESLHQSCGSSALRKDFLYVVHSLCHPRQLLVRLFKSETSFVLKCLVSYFATGKRGSALRKVMMRGNTWVEIAKQLIN